MRSTKIFLGILIFFIIATGCIRGDKDNTAKTPKDNLPKLSIIADSEQALALFKSEEENIAEKFGVQLEYHFPDRLDDNLEDFLFASEKTYDMYILFPGKIPQYVERDMLLPLDQYLQTTDDLDDILPVYRNLYMKYGGHDYGMVYDGDTHLLFYRKDIFEKFNDEYRQWCGKDLEPPKTWEEYDDISHFLTKDFDDDGQIDLYGTAIFGGEAKRYVWFAERFISRGGKFFKKNMEPSIVNDKGVTALQELILLNDGGATPPNAMYDWIDLNNSFLHGEIAMTIQWSDTARFSYDKENWGSLVENKVGWALVPSDDPQNPRGGVWIGRVIGISKQSNHPDKAWEVISYITSKKVSAQATISKGTINDPFRYSHFELDGKGAFPTEEMNRDFLNTVKQSLEHPNSDLMIPGGWEYMQALDENIHLALVHKKTAEQALQDTEKEWEKITERYGRDSQAQHYQQWLQLLEEVSDNEVAK